MYHCSSVGGRFVQSSLLSSFLRRLDRVSSSNSLFDRRNDSSGVRHTTRRPLFLPWRARRDGRRGRLGVFAALERDATSELGPGAHGARVAQAPVAWAAQAVQNGQGCRTVSHFPKALSGSLLRVSPGVSRLSRGCSSQSSSVSSLEGPHSRSAHLSSRSLLKRVD